MPQYSKSLQFIAFWDEKEISYVRSAKFSNLDHLLRQPLNKFLLKMHRNFKTPKQTKLRAVPYFWMIDSLVMSKLENSKTLTTCWGASPPLASKLKNF